MYFTFDSNNFEIIADVSRQFEPVAHQWCSDFNLCEMKTVLSRAYLFYDTPVFFANLNGAKDPFDVFRTTTATTTTTETNNTAAVASVTATTSANTLKQKLIHFIFMDLTMPNSIQTRKYVTTLTKNLPYLPGRVVFFTFDYKMLQQKIQKAYITYDVARRTFNSKIYARFLKLLIQVCRLKNGKWLCTPDDVAHLWAHKRLPGTMQNIKLHMPLDLDKFQYDQCQSKKLDNDCTLCD